MRPAFLLLDDALTGQDALLRAASAHDASTIDARTLGPALRLWTRPAAFTRLSKLLDQSPLSAFEPNLVFYGSGDFHHVSYVLIARALEALDAPATILHFDNHPDWVNFTNGMHCGSWAAKAAAHPRVARFMTIGVCSDDIDRPEHTNADLDGVRHGRVELYPYSAPRGTSGFLLEGREWPTIEMLGESAFIDFLMARIVTEHVYVTIDKDVLRAEDAATNWDQGRLRLDFLEEILGRIAAAHTLIGVDICGDWSTPRYGDTLLASLLKRGEALLDQPWRKPAPGARAANERTNLRLLKLLMGHVVEERPAVMHG